MLLYECVASNKLLKFFIAKCYESLIMALQPSKKITIKENSQTKENGFLRNDKTGLWLKCSFNLIEEPVCEEKVVVFFILLIFSVNK